LAVEASLAAAPSVEGFGLARAERRRSGLLRQDLLALGATPLGVPVAPLPRLGTAAAAMGRLYVTEGATLGGRVLARGLEGLLGPGESGRAFLLGHGARHAAMWQGFCAALERCGADPAQLAAMQEEAGASFAAFEAWFGAPGWMPPESQEADAA
jgi:heme oxygenase